MNPDSVFFTSDTHFYHRNILKFCPERPWTTVEEMNDGMIENWNLIVPPHGHIFHLGDIAFSSPKKTAAILERLNGRKYLLRGNHDHIKPVVAEQFEWVKDYHEMKIDGQMIVLCHYPMRSWNRAFHGSYMLHGHVHGEFEPHTDQGKWLDVGLESAIKWLGHPWPFSFNDIKRVMDQKEWVDDRPARSED